MRDLHPAVCLPIAPAAAPVALCRRSRCRRRSRCCLRRLLAGIIILQTTMADPRDAEIAHLKKQLAEKDRTHNNNNNNNNYSLYLNRQADF